MSILDQIPRNAPLLICPHQKRKKIFFIYLKEDRAAIFICDRCARLYPIAPGKDDPDTWVPRLEQARYIGATKKWIQKAAIVEIDGLPLQFKGKKRRLMKQGLNWYDDDLIDEFDVFRLYYSLFNYEILMKTKSGINPYKVYEKTCRQSAIFDNLPKELAILKTPSKMPSMFRAPGTKGDITIATFQLAIVHYGFKEKYEKMTATDRAVMKAMDIAAYLHEMVHAARAWDGVENYWDHDDSFLKALSKMYVDILPLDGIEITGKDIEERIKMTGNDRQQCIADLITYKCAGVCIYKHDLQKSLS